jgi:hypothetical protein
MNNGLGPLPPDTFLSELDPLIVTSPVIRSGTTLVQRLLCSSPRTLIFGETAAEDLALFLNVYIFKAQQYQHQMQRYAEATRQVLAGNVNEWIPDLMPDVNGYLAALGRAAFAGVAYCRSYARESGRQVWGFKYPGWQPSTIRLLRTTMPRARFIYVYRDVVDCLKSAKARGLVNSPAEVHEFCRAWAEGLSDALGGDAGEALLLLSYDDLLADRATATERIARFSGADGIDASVLQHKINTRPGETFAEQRDGYTTPSELTGDELQIVERATSAVRVRVFGARIRPTGLEQPERMV